MGKTKSGLVCQYVLMASMYLSHVFLWLMFIFAVKDSDGSFDGAVGTMLVLFFVMLGVAALLGLLCLVFGVVNVFRESADPTKSTLICKLCLVPWYVVNFVFCALVVAGFCNPWLLVGIPVVIAVGCCLTWWTMFCTGVANLSYVVLLLRQGKLQVDTKLVLAIVFHFVFVLDIVGAFLLRDAIAKIPTPVVVDEQADPFVADGE